MGLQPWSRFRAAHPDACLVVAEVTAGRQAWFALLSSLASALHLSGEHSLLPEPTRIWIAFGRENDAAKFAAAVGARVSAVESGWTAQWVVVCTEELAASIRAVLPASRSRRAGRSRPNSRALPF